MKGIKVLCVIVFLFCVLSGQAQVADRLQEYVLKEWNDFQMPKENAIGAILAKQKEIGKYIATQDRDAVLAQLENGNQVIYRVATLYKENKNTKIKKSILKKVLNSVDLKRQEVVHCDRMDCLIENYYGLKAIMEGTPVDEAWGGMWFNTSVETIGNEYDYERYRQVFELNNPELTQAYMSCLKYVFRYNGYTKGLEELRPFFEKYMPEGDLKNEIEGLYKSYYHLREGAEAPAFTLKDFKGKEHSLADYRGKVLVIDVWATWCGGCIAKLPVYVSMSQKYKDRDDIEFITISIDDKGAFNSWKYALPRLKLLGITNLLASKEECTFQKDYNITGIPRYFLIDKEGKIVSVYAPTPGKAFEALINKTLNRK